MATDIWWRFYCEAITDRKFVYLSKSTGLSKIELLGAWAILCTIATQSPVYGALRVTLRVMLRPNNIAEELGLNLEKTEQLLENMVEANMLKVGEDGCFWVVNLSKRQYKSTAGAERQRKWRERQKTKNVDDVTRYVTRNGTETETESINITGVFTPENASESAPAPEKNGTKKTKSGTKKTSAVVQDARKDHPAITAVRQAIGRFPPKVAWDTIIAEIGDSPDSEKLLRVVRDWGTRGYNPNNWRGILDAYKANGIKPLAQSGKVKGKMLGVEI